MSDNCVLRIKTPDFTIHFEGDGQFVKACYEAVREEVLNRLGPGLDTISAAETVVIPTVSAIEAKSDQAMRAAEQQYVWVHRCFDLYNKVQVIQRTDMERRPIGRYIHSWRIHRVYLESADDHALQSLVPLGKTLWSELTPLGRERLQNS